MPSDKPSIRIPLTHAQIEALDKARGELGKAEFVRQAIAQACHRNGVRFPDDMPARGTYPRQKSNERVE
jgi:hypothetical protein